MYELFANDLQGCLSCAMTGVDQLEIKCQKISPKLGGWKNAVLWNMATLGKVKAYVVCENEKIIHFSYVAWGREKFRFLNTGDIEIGPCWTHPDYRGRGIYPAVLSHIIQKELAGGGGTAYMIIHETNEASQHGVAKAGFTKNGAHVEKDFMKRYRICKQCGNELKE